jgi:hypothetical protein
MKFPNWFRIAWWVGLITLVTYFLRLRYADVIAGQATPIDALILVIWFGLLLVPLFNEITLPGVTLKREVEELKRFVSSQVTDIRNDVRTAVELRTTVNSNVIMPAPAPDSQLREIEKSFKAFVSEALQSHGKKLMEVTSTPISIPEDVSYLFSARYAIESEMRRIARGRDLVSDMPRAVPTFQLMRSLIDAGVIEPQMGNAIRELYAVCSAAIHGQPVSSNQAAFVKDVGPPLIEALRALA